MSKIVPRPDAQNLFRWARDLTDYLLDRDGEQGFEVLANPIFLQHRRPGDKPVQAGVMMYDPQLGTAVIADGQAWRPLILPSSMMNDNLIPDGMGRLNQTGYVSGTPTAAANRYTLDMWKVVVSGQSLLWTGSAAGRTMTAPAGGVETFVEGLNVNRTGPATLSWDGTATAKVDGVDVANGGQAPVTGGTQIVVRMTGGTFTRVKLEHGTFATPFPAEAWQTVHNRCARYIWAPNIFYTVQCDADTAKLSRTYNQIFFPVPMRVTPATTSFWSNSVQVSAGSFQGSPHHFDTSIVTVVANVNGSARINWTQFDARIY